MEFKKQPQPNPAKNLEPQETKSPEQASEITPEPEKRESITLNFDAIKNIIISQIGNKAEINRLEIAEVNEGAKLSAEIDAGMLGGKISIEGYIVNDQNGIAIRNLSINARGYVKSRIENSLSSFGSAIKKYFEKQYEKSVSSIQIVGPNLVIDLGSSLQVSVSQDNKTQIEQYLEIIDKIKDPWERIGNIETYCRALIKLEKYDDARRMAGLIKNEKSRNATIDNIGRIEKSGM